MSQINLGVLSTIQKTLTETPITVIARRSWGKSQVTKRIYEGLIYKGYKVIIFDPSLNHYVSSPALHKQNITRKIILNGGVVESDQIVYGIGQLTKDEKKAFIASVISREYKARYNKVLNGADPKTLSKVLYVIEEANTILNGSALRKNDITAQVLLDAVSIGRNFNIMMLMIVTRPNELATEVLERSALLLGNISGENTLNKLKRATSTNTVNTITQLTKYSFIFYNDGLQSTPFKLPFKQYLSPVEVTNILTTNEVTNNNHSLIDTITTLTMLAITLYPLIWLLTI